MSFTLHSDNMPWILLPPFSVHCLILPGPPGNPGNILIFLIGRQHMQKCMHFSSGCLGVNILVATTKTNEWAYETSERGCIQNLPACRGEHRLEQW